MKQRDNIIKLICAKFQLDKNYTTHRDYVLKD